MSSEEAVRRFIDCSICVGYCHTSGRADYAEIIQKDLLGLVELLGDGEGEINKKLLLLLQNSEEWVKYHAALFLLNQNCIEALEALELLEKQNDGMYSLLASVAVSRVKK